MTEMDFRYAEVRLSPDSDHEDQLARLRALYAVWGDSKRMLDWADFEIGLMQHELWPESHPTIQDKH